MFYRDSQAILAKTFLKPFWAITRLPMVDQPIALKRCLHELELAMRANQFRDDISAKLQHFCDVVTDSPALIPNALETCGISSEIIEMPYREFGHDTHLVNRDISYNDQVRNEYNSGRF